MNWGDAWTNCEGCECKLTKNMFLHSDLLKLYLKKNKTSLISSLIKLCFRIKNLGCEVMGYNDRGILTNQIVIVTSSTYVEPYKCFRTFLNKFSVLLIYANVPNSNCGYQVFLKCILMKPTTIVLYGLNG